MAHIGAWRSLTDAGLTFEGIVGTSIGGLVAVALAAGRSVDDLEARARTLRRRDILRVDRGAIWVNGIRETSVFRGDVVRDYFDDLVPDIPWSELSHRVQLNAVDLASGEAEWFGAGAREDVSLADAVYATAALPVLFPPAEVGGRYFVDGGALDTLAIGRAAELGATGILAIDVGSSGEVDAEEVVRTGLISVHQRVFAIMSEARRREVVDGWDGVPMVYVRPELDGYATFDFAGIPYFLEEGQRSVEMAIGSAS